MRKFKYSCDGGAIALGNETFTCHYMNNYGDGTHLVHIKEPHENFPYGDYREWHFEGSIEGTFNVYIYDCLPKKELTDKANILTTLTGRYGIYSKKGDYSGDMLLEHW